MSYHLVGRLFIGPILHFNPVNRGHYAGAVYALSAMNQHGVVRLVAEDFQKQFYFVWRGRNILNGEGVVIQAEGCRIFGLRMDAAQVHDSAEAFILQRLQLCIRWLGRAHALDLAIRGVFQHLRACARS